MKRLISLAVFAVVATITWWSTTEYFDEEKQAPAQLKQYVEIFMNEFEMTAMNEKGLPAYTLNGKHLERLNDSDDTEIEQPIVHMLEPDKQWRISADFALLNDKNSTIQLKDNVIMQQQNTEPTVTIRTQNMMIYTRTQIARTKAKVDVTQGKSQLTSNGMIYNNMTSELELTSSVNGYYLPYE